MFYMIMPFLFMINNVTSGSRYFTPTQAFHRFCKFAATFRSIVATISIFSGVLTVQSLPLGLTLGAEAMFLKLLIVAYLL